MSPVIVLSLIGNLIPLAGLYYWHWDPFQLLMLYWMETAIVAGWSLARIATLPESLLGRIKVIQCVGCTAGSVGLRSE